MKQNAVVASAIRSRHELKALPELIAEFNMNRYATPTVGNIVSEDTDGNDIEMFPLESIVEPIRPSKGINKARVGHGTVADDYQKQTTPRFYVSAVDDPYKYWQSPTVSDSAGFIANAEPRVTYSTPLTVNKIVIGVENSWATPTAYTIQVTDSGGAVWRPTATAPVDNDGRITIWWDGSAWTATKPADLTATTVINGVKFVCTRLGAGKKIDGTNTQYRYQGGTYDTTGAYSYLSVIEISPRLVVDLSSKVISCSDTFDAGEASHLTPIGTITTNTANIDLWDVNEGSPVWAQYLEPNIEMNLRYIYTIDGVKYPIQQFKMYTDTWSENDDQTYTVTMSDASKYLKEIKPRPGKYEKMTLSQIMYRLLDGAGFTEYNIFNNPRSIDYKIPVFWVDGEKTIWEVFDELAVATQSLVYFDSNGKLNVKTREDAYWSGAPINWALRAKSLPDGTELADIVSATKTDEYEANVIKVVYKSAEWADEVNGFVEFSTVWSPEETLTLRASPLVRNMGVDAGYIHLSPPEATIWPYEGLVQIEGELIRYEGKVFVYHEGGAVKSVTVKDQSEFDKYNELAPVGLRYRNYFDGRLRILNRGEWNTEQVEHTVDANGYEVRRWGNGQLSMSRAGFRHNRGDSTVTLSHDGLLGNYRDAMIATRGSSNDTGWRHMGVRIKPSRYGGVDQRGGLVFNQKGADDGYYVEITPSLRVNENGKADNRKEVSFFARNGNSGGTILKTGTATIVDEQWHNLDVFYDWGSQRVSVWIDGKKIFDVVPPGNLQIAPNGKFGMFIRGKSVFEYEYLYGIARGDEPEFQNDFSVYNRLTGWQESQTLTKEWVYKWRNRRRVKKKTVKSRHRWNFQMLDEFGPYVHEVREFDVKFDPAPVQHSKLYMTNTYSAMLLDYRANAFGAKFTVANTARTHAVMNGEDAALGAVGEGSDGQQMFVFGRALVIGEQEEVIERNEPQIRSRGEIITEVSSDWIQTKGAADALAKWISSHWSRGADEVSMEIFGNPLLEVGDLVSVDYLDKKMYPTTHHYFVTSTSTSFSAGLSTSLVLRRKN